MGNSFSLDLLNNFDSFHISKKNSKFSFIAKKSIKNKFISKENIEKAFSGEEEFNKGCLNLKFKSNLNSIFGRLGNNWRMNLEQYEGNTKILINNGFDYYEKPFNPFTKEINIEFTYRSNNRYFKKDNSLDSLKEFQGIPLDFLEKLSKYISLEK